MFRETFHAYSWRLESRGVLIIVARKRCRVLGKDFSGHDYLLDAGPWSTVDASSEEQDTPSEFGGNMSICIAAIASFTTADRRVICVTDRKASSIEFSNENATVKMYPVNKNWLAMYAGDDISPCVPIISAAGIELRVKENTLEAVKSAFASCFQKHLSNLAVSLHLGRWKLSMEEFLETGRKKFGADNFDVIWTQIQQVRLRCKFLVCGFSKDGMPHLFMVQNPGVVEDKDVPGYWAIGNGAYAAMSTLGFLQQSIITPVAETFYNVWSAKFMAEGASEVGKNSFLTEIVPNGDSPRLDDAKLEHIVRQAWESGGKPSMPDGIVEEIKSLLESTQSAAQRSKQGQ